MQARLEAKSATTVATIILIVWRGKRKLWKQLTKFVLSYFQFEFNTYNMADQPS